MNTIARTPLYPLHLDLGAKLQPFGGYLMPMQYSAGIIHEHLHTRHLAGFFDISHMGQIVVSGRTAAQELQNLTPSAITGLQHGGQQYTVFTNESGGIIDDAIITCLEAKFFIIVNASCKQKDLLHLQKHLSSNCQIELLSQHALFALQGPAATAVIGKFCSAPDELLFMTATHTEINGIPCLISRSGYTGEDGFEISVEAQHALTLAKLLLAQSSVEPVGLGARNTLRLEAGLCLYGNELNATTSPVEAGLSWLINKQHSQYPGAESILRQIQQPPDSKRAGLISEQKVPVRDGAELYDSDNQLVGQVTSGSFGPSIGHPIAMARLKSACCAPGTIVYSTVRKHNIAFTVTPLPFIPHKYHRNNRI